MKLSIPFTAFLALASSVSAAPKKGGGSSVVGGNGGGSGTTTASNILPTNLASLCTESQSTQVAQALASYGLQSSGYSVGISNGMVEIKCLTKKTCDDKLVKLAIDTFNKQNTGCQVKLTNAVPQQGAANNAQLNTQLAAAGLVLVGGVLALA